MTTNARTMRHIMHLIERYAKAKAQGRKQSDCDVLRSHIHKALLPIIGAAALAREALKDE